MRFLSQISMVLFTGCTDGIKAIFNIISVFYNSIGLAGACKGGDMIFWHIMCMSA